MTRTELHRWRMRWGEKIIRTRHHMTEEKALAMDPQAEKIPGTRMVVEPLDANSPHYISVGGAPPQAPDPEAPPR